MSAKIHRASGLLTLCGRASEEVETGPAPTCRRCLRIWHPRLLCAAVDRMGASLDDIHSRRGAAERRIVLAELLWLAGAHHEEIGRLLERSPNTIDGWLTALARPSHLADSALALADDLGVPLESGAAGAARRRLETRRTRAAGR